MRLAAVILAAGTGSRMQTESGPPNKLLCRLGGETLLRRCCRVVSQAGFSPIVIVLGHEAERLRPEIPRIPAEVVLNERFEEGQATSVARGVEALQSDGVGGEPVDGAVFVPADQAGLDVATLERLAQAFTASEGQCIAVPRWRERRGSPVVFPRAHFGALRSLDGDAGGRQLLAQHEEDIVWVELDDDLPLLDADTPAALRAVAERLGCEPSLAGAAS